MSVERVKLHDKNVPCVIHRNQSPPLLNQNSFTGMRKPLLYIWSIWYLGDICIHCFYCIF